MMSGRDPRERRLRVLEHIRTDWTATALGETSSRPTIRDGAAPVVIVGGILWRTRYGSDPSLVGKTIRVSGVPSTVVGIMPGRFGFPDNADLWMPLVALPDEWKRASRGTRSLEGTGRLRSDVTIEQAGQELSRITASLAERYPDTNRGTMPIVEGMPSQADRVHLVCTLRRRRFVLLIACANVANLLLARAANRGRDVMLRLALGASRWRIIRQLLVESLLLATAGGLCGRAVLSSHSRVPESPANSRRPTWCSSRWTGRVLPCRRPVPRQRSSAAWCRRGTLRRERTSRRL